MLTIAKDYRSNRPNGVGIGEIVVKLREIIQAKLLPAEVIPQLVPSAEPNEYFILDRIDFFVLVQNVVAAAPNQGMLIHYKFRSTYKPIALP